MRALARRMLAATAAAVPLSLAACSGITWPLGDQGTDPSPASFWVTVRTEWEQVSQDGSRTPSVRVDGGLETGFDDDGDPRILGGTRVVRFGGGAEAVLRPLGNGRSHSYEIVLPVGRDALAVEPLVVSVPAVEGLVPVAAELRLRAPTRLGPDSITIARGAPLRLTILPSAAPSEPAAELTRWQLVVQGATLPALFQLVGNGPLPAELVVPAEYLRTEESRLTATLSVSQEFHTYYRQPEPSYDVRYRVETPIHWRVAIRP